MTSFSTLEPVIRLFKKYSGRRLSTVVQNNPIDHPLNNHHNQNYQKPRSRYKSIRQVKPEQVGITEFVGQHRKLRAIVKKRVADFQVREIDLNGQIIQLNSLRPPRDDWNRDEPYHTHCTLFKEKVPWTEVIRFLSERLQIDPNDICCAGMKDKWAKTSQRISILNVNARRLSKVSQKSWSIKLGDFSYSSSPITNGDLLGNNFRILLRKVSAASSSTDSFSVTDDFERAAQSLTEYGFINYFGLQRFGLNGGHLLGKAMLQQNWEKVFDIILQPNEYDTDYLAQAKAVWFSRHDALECVKLFPTIGNYSFFEASLFRGLAQHYDGGAGDLLAAFQAIPEVYRNIYYAAIKSFLWNHVASFRIKTLGLKPVPGDVVSVNDEEEEGVVVVDANLHLNDGPLGANRVCMKQGKRTSDPQKFKILKEQDFVNGDCQKYSIFDVLLPVPGSLMSKYPNEIVQEYYEKLLAENELDVDCFQKFREIYHKDDQPHSRFFRQLTVKPHNFTYKIFPYSHSDQLDTLIPSDWDLLNCPPTERSSAQFMPSMPSVDLLEGDQKMCAYLEFSLPRCSYATMAFRELLNNYNF